jgi:FKBP-type peptidyl-prolyl cis-trans isomerase
MLMRIVFPTVAAASVLALAVYAQPTTKPATTQAAATQPAGKETTTASGLKIIEVAPGDAAAKAGDIVFVRYTGTLADGKEFDSTAKHGGDPIRFTLGKREVIQGWDEGIAGMKVGEKRKLIIPPALAYGEKGQGKDIPPNAELHFDVELVGFARIGE